jgi:hypothetical protein
LWDLFKVDANNAVCTSTSLVSTGLILMILCSRGC